MPERESYPFPALRARIAQLAAEGREAEREAAAWELADRIARLGDGASIRSDGRPSGVRLACAIR